FFMLWPLFYDDFLTVNDYKDVWEVNTCGVIRVTQTFRDLIKKSRGRIVICTSATTLFPKSSHGPYSCSKFAVQAYCIIIRHELQSYGVDVIEIMPGCFETGINDIQEFWKSTDTVWYRASQELRDEYGHNYNEKVKAYAADLKKKIVALDTTWVIDSYYEAIVAKRPKLLYRVGWDMLLKFYPYSFLPVHLQVHVMKLLLYLSGAPLPAIVTKNAHAESLKEKNN
ncbi:oxidoreductase, partial [Wuchereria bancrofti]